MGQRIVRMTEEFFQLFLTHGGRFPPVPGRELVCVEGLPADARLVDVRHEFLTAVVLLKFESPSWDAVPACHAIPEAQVRYELRDVLPDAVSDLTPMEEMALRRSGG
jgi:hypothetical protein